MDPFDRMLGSITHRRVPAPDLGVEPPEWMLAAVCASTDPEIFFPEKGGSVREAKRVCNGTVEQAGCPVKAECLTYAIDHHERFGIWGSLTERERRRVIGGMSVDRATRSDNRGDDGDCPVCGLPFRSVRQHRAKKAACYEAGAA